MGPFKLCLWKHWFWITSTKHSSAMAQRQQRSSCLLLLSLLLCLTQLTAIASAAPVGAVDTKSITFKKFALDGGDGKGGPGDKPMVAAASMVGGRKTQRVTLNGGGVDNSAEDAVGHVMDGHEELSRIFVTFPTTLSSSSSSSSSISSASTTSMPSTSTESAAIATEAKVAEETTPIKSKAEDPQGKESRHSEVDTVELSSASSDPNVIKSSDKHEDDQKSLKSIKPEEGSLGMARIVQVSVNPSQSTVIDGTGEDKRTASIEETDTTRIDAADNIQNLVLVREDTDEVTNETRNRKSKGLTDDGSANSNKNLLTRSTSTGGDENLEAGNPQARLQSAGAQNLNRSPNLLIQFSDSDKLELINSQNNALTSDDLSRVKSSNLGLISGISFSVVALFCAVSLVGAMMYRRRYVNKPQTLSEPDSSGYIDDSIIRENSDEMYSLDNDSFLNSLEAMTIQNYWTDHVKHTKL